MVLKVKMGGFEVSKSPEILETLLGSCVAIMLYDPGKRVGGMAHIMLPETRDMNTKTPGKYANTAILAMIAKMVILGARPEKLVAKLAGGAKMFKSKSNAMDIGTKNINAAKRELKKYEIKIVGEDLGGTSGRTVRFTLRDGKVFVRVKNSEKII
ncbi:MAG: chemotaxis protein CheD [Methanothermococcus sp.]|uniref:chemotaxis protein CheD n=1 Tax=Methanothermococcus sp. TaxID=2614238 RepID=UPI002586D70F|nr:chemotaxis protein CheD [Methanothermococcus sp.]MDK2790557.1 chemotaxis protein CheD [Methanothermococcus sp.]MDK2988106.1 chemotaxis protein CheD [Methanothermococcus sp.]